MAASRGKVGRVGRHFVAAEFRCPHCQAAVISPRLIHVLESIRAHVNRPVRIVSGYRCPIHNAAIGGAEDSMHMYGRAADLETGIVSPAAAAHAGAVGIGVKAGWAVHVDVREGSAARWSY